MSSSVSSQKCFQTNLECRLAAADGCGNRMQWAQGSWESMQIHAAYNYIHIYIYICVCVCLIFIYEIIRYDWYMIDVDASVAAEGADMGWRWMVPTATKPRSGRDKWRPTTRRCGRLQHLIHLRPNKSARLPQEASRRPQFQDIVRMHRLSALHRSTSGVLAVSTATVIWQET